MRSDVWRGSRYCAQLPHLIPTWFTSKIPKARDSPSFSSVGNVEHDTRAMHALIYPRKERNAPRRESSRASWRMIETSAASFRELKPNSTHPVVCIFIFFTCGKRNPVDVVSETTQWMGAWRKVHLFKTLCYLYKILYQPLCEAL